MWSLAPGGQTKILHSVRLRRKTHMVNIDVFSFVACQVLALTSHLRATIDAPQELNEFSLKMLTKLDLRI